MQTRFRVYDRLGAERGQLPNPLEAVWVPPLNAVPTLTIHYSLLEAKSEYLEDQPEVAFEYLDESGNWVEPFNARFKFFEEDFDHLEDTPTKSYTFLGVGEALLGQTVYDRYGRNLTSWGRIDFPEATAGEIISDVWDNAESRGWKGFNYDFTATHDSNGQPWAQVFNISYEKTSNMAHILDGLVRQGACDYVWEGRTLHLYNAHTFLAREKSTGSSPVLFNLSGGPAGVDGAPEMVNTENLATHVIVMGENNLRWVFPTGANLPEGRREVVLQYSGVNDTGTARILADPTILKSVSPLMNTTRQFHLTDETKIKPLIHYRIGDWCLVERQSEYQRMQIISMSLWINQNGVHGYVTLGDKVDDTLEKMYQNIQGLTGGKANEGVGEPPRPENRVPKIPTSLIVSAEAYPGSGGEPEGLVAVSLTHDFLDTQGDPINLDHFEVQMKEVVTTPEVRSWSVGTRIYTPDTAGTISSVDIYDVRGDVKEYDFRVYAISQEGRRSGASATKRLTMVEDSVPPPIPSTPTVIAQGITFTITSDGLGSVGESMPADYSTSIVQMGTSETGPWASVGAITRAGSLTIPAGGYHTRWFRMYSVDTSGNESDPSGVVSAETTPLISDQEFNDKVNELSGDLGAGIDFALLRANVARYGDLIDDGDFELGIQDTPYRLEVPDAYSKNYVARVPADTWRTIYHKPDFIPVKAGDVLEVYLHARRSTASIGSVSPYITFDTFGPDEVDTGRDVHQDSENSTIPVLSTVWQPYRFRTPVGEAGFILDGFARLRTSVGGSSYSTTGGYIDIDNVRVRVVNDIVANEAATIAIAKAEQDAKDAAALDAKNKVEALQTTLQANIDAAIASGQSIIVGGNFESGDKDWPTNASQYTRDSTTARSGSKVLFISPDNANHYPVSNYVPSGKGKTFYLEAYFRRLSGTDNAATLGFVVQSNTAAGGFSTPFMNPVSASALSATAWTKVSATYTIPDTVDATRTRFAPWVQQSTNDYEIDDFTVLDVTAATDALIAAKADATTKANTAQQNAITAAATDATTKFNNAVAEAERLWSMSTRSFYFAGDRDDLHTGDDYHATPVSDGFASGSVLRKTGGSGTIYFDKDPLPFDPNSLYRITWVVRAVSDATNITNAALYAGVHAWSAGANGGPGYKLSVNGISGASSAHYFSAGPSLVKAAEGWRTFTGYFRGFPDEDRGTDIGGEHLDILDPGAMHPDTRYISPMAFTDYNGGNGTWDVGMVAIDVISPEHIAAVVTAQQAANDAQDTADKAITAIQNTAVWGNFDDATIRDYLAKPNNLRGNATHGNDPAKARSGSGYIELTGNGSYNEAYAPNIPTTPGHTYRATFYMWMSTNYTGSVGFPNMWEKEDGTSLNSPWSPTYSHEDRENQVAGAWFKVEGDVVAPEGTVAMIPRFLMWPVTTGGTGVIVRFDDFEWRDITEAIKAQERADDAWDEADKAYKEAVAAGQVASGKTTVLPVVPTTADLVGKPAGALWTQVVAGKVVGAWYKATATSTSWTAMPFDPVMIPQVNIGTGTFGELDGVRLKAKTIGVRELIVADYTNILAGGDFEDATKVPWDLNVAHRVVPGTTSNLLKMGNLTTGTKASYLKNKIDVRPGEFYYFRFRILIDSNFNGDGNSKIRFANGSGTLDGYTVSRSTTYNDQARNVYVEYEGTIEITTAKSLEVGIWSTNSAGYAYLDDFEMRRMNNGELTVDGSVKARAIDTLDLVSDTGFISDFRAHVVKSDLFDGKAFVGGTFTGGVFQSHSEANKGVKHTAAGTTAYTPTGAIGFALSSSTGRGIFSGRVSTSIGNESGTALLPAADSDGGKTSGVFITFDSALVGQVSAGVYVDDTTVTTPQELQVRGWYGGGVIAAGRQFKVANNESGMGDFVSYTIKPLGQQSYIPDLQLNDHPTTSSGANALIAISPIYGRIYRSTSSLYRKADVQPYTREDPYWVLGLKESTWVDRDPMDPSDPFKRYTGYIAEWTHEVAPEFVTYNEWDEPDAVQYDRMPSPAVLPLLRDVVRRLDELEGKS